MSTAYRCFFHGQEPSKNGPLHCSCCLIRTDAGYSYLGTIEAYQFGLCVACHATASESDEAMIDVVKRVSTNFERLIKLAPIAREQVREILASGSNVIPLFGGKS